MDWGDGTAADTTSVAAYSEAPTTARHDYAVRGTYQVRVTVSSRNRLFGGDRVLVEQTGGTSITID